MNESDREDPNAPSADDETLSEQDYADAAVSLAGRTRNRGFLADVEKVLRTELSEQAPSVETYDNLMLRLMSLLGPDSGPEAEFLLVNLGLLSEEDDPEVNGILSLLNADDAEGFLGLVRALRPSFIVQMQQVLQMRDREAEDWLSVVGSNLRNVTSGMLATEIEIQRNDMAALRLRTSPQGLLVLASSLVRFLNELPDDQDELLTQLPEMEDFLDGLLGLLERFSAADDEGADDEEESTEPDREVR